MSELEQMLQYAIYQVEGPVAIRYPRGGSDRFGTNGPPYEPMMLKDGSDIVIVSYGRMVENAMGAARILDKYGISAMVIKLTEISNVPLDKFYDLVGDIEYVFIAEECVSGGCLASKLALELSSSGYTNSIIPINLGNAILPAAGVDELMRMCSLDPVGIAGIVRSICVKEALA